MQLRTRIVNRYNSIPFFKKLFFLISNFGIITIEKNFRFFYKYKIILINLSVITSVLFWFSCLIMNKSWLSVAC